MNRFWQHYIHPLIETAQPKRLMEIGADAGWNTRNILDYCRAAGAHADIIDPAPQSDFHDVLAQFDSAQYRYLPLKSVMAIPQLDTPDVALIDGDHNWATVHSELNLLQARAEQNGVPPPIVLSHDVGWPYARRDMYYNPDDLDASQKHPYAYRGMLPGVSELVEHGMNGTLANALHDGGPRNGVLTAIEDYIASAGIPFVFRALPFFNGLGILIPVARMTPAVQTLLDGFFSAEKMLEACIALEADNMQLQVLLTRTGDRLARRTDELKRTHGVVALQRTRILAMKQLIADHAAKAE